MYGYVVEQLNSDVCSMCFRNLTLLDRSNHTSSSSNQYQYQWNIWIWIWIVWHAFLQNNWILTILPPTPHFEYEMKQNIYIHKIHNRIVLTPHNYTRLFSIIRNVHTYHNFERPFILHTFIRNKLIIWPLKTYSPLSVTTPCTFEIATSVYVWVFRYHIRSPYIQNKQPSPHNPPFIHKTNTITNFYRPTFN